MNKLYHGDCLEIMKDIPDESVNLVLTDPPYNIAKAEWDKISDYIEWCVEWMKECQRVLKPNGVFYFWHNDIRQIAELMEAINDQTDFEFISFCIWDKGPNYRRKFWANRDPDANTAPRSWFNVCEYCLHFFKSPKIAGVNCKATGLDRINSNPECYKPIKDWYRAECKRLGLTTKSIAEYYTKVTGKKPYMLRHYFQNSQFRFPTEKIWNEVYRPLGFCKEYEDLRMEYEDLRNYHRCDAEHCNIWNVPYTPASSKKRVHPCEKPQEILQRLIKVSCKPGGTVLDCFMGAGSTGIAATVTGRNFIGIEKDDNYFEIAKNRIEETENQLRFI